MLEEDLEEERGEEEELDENDGLPAGSLLRLTLAGGVRVLRFVHEIRRPGSCVIRPSLRELPDM